MPFETEIDLWLSRRRGETPPPSPGLADRIIHAARACEQEAPRFFLSVWLEEAAASLAMPVPALAVGALLLAGFVLGSAADAMWPVPLLGQPECYAGACSYSDGVMYDPAS